MGENRKYFPFIVRPTTGLICLAGRAKQLKDSVQLGSPASRPLARGGYGCHTQLRYLISWQRWYQQKYPS